MTRIALIELILTAIATMSAGFTCGIFVVEISAQIIEFVKTETKPRQSWQQ